MKKTIKKFFLLLALAVAGIMQSHAQVSKNIVDSTKVWNNWEVVTNGIRTNSYKISSEQVELNEILYNKVLQQYHSDFLLDEDFSYKGILIREDSGKVYILFEQQPDTELLLYNFNAEKDSYYKIPYIARGILSTDSFEDYKNGFVVTSVDSIEIDNQQLKRITLNPTSDNCEYYEQIQWIEGIGSTMGFIDNFYGI